MKANFLLTCKSCGSQSGGVVHAPQPTLSQIKATIQDKITTCENCGGQIDLFWKEFDDAKIQSQPGFV